jgi:hypothetical protein
MMFDTFFLRRAFSLRRVSGPALAVLFALFLSACFPAIPTPDVSPQEPGAPAAFESPYPPPPTNTPEPPPYVAPSTSTPRPTPLPACQFPGGPPAPSNETSLDDYVFSEPQVVLTHTSSIDIAGWLPDNQRLLITRHIPGLPRETIETFNVQTGETILYGERHDFDSFNPIWLAGEQAILYIDRTADGQVLLQKIQAPNQPPIDLAAGLNYSNVAVSPDEQHLIFFDEGQKEQADFLSLSAEQPYFQTITLPPPLGAEAGRVDLTDFASTWSPDGTRIAFYRNPELFLVEPATGQACEVLFEGPRQWVFYARWSPDGRFLAMITTPSFNRPLLSTDLAVLDIVTGDIRTFQVTPEIEPGRHSITDIAWEPNSRYLAILGVIGYEGGFTKQGLFLVDSFQEEGRWISSENDIGGGVWGNQLFWSNDGSSIAINCPTQTEGRLCITSVTLNNQ